jgi:Uma2 family endonuclease
MSVAITPPPAETGAPLLTAADLALFPSELSTGPVFYELDNGRLIIMPPPGDIHCAVELKIGVQLFLQGEARGLGKARSGGVGVILWRNPDRVVGPDALFVTNASLPLNLSPEGYLETIPDLVVEVRSKNDTLSAIQRKVYDYLKAGVRIVWVADPEARTVTAHRSGQEPHVFGQADDLLIEDIIPGFRMSVADVFRL